MHRFSLVIVFAICAAGASTISILEAVTRHNGQPYLIVPDAYLSILRFTALGLWMLFGMAVATRVVRRTIAKHLARQTERITAVVQVCVDAVLSDVEQKKVADIDGMLKEYGIDTSTVKRTGTSTDVAGSINLLEFRSRKPGGDT